MAKLVEEAEYDTRWAGEKYGGEHAGYSRFFVKFMKQWTSTLPKPVRAVEIGCGAGYFSGKLLELGCEVTGLDLSPVGVAQAQARHPAGRFIVHDLSQPLPFSDASIDLVWCSEVLEHLFSPLGVLQEMQRILRAGGLALCTVPYHGLVKNVGIALFAFDRHYDPTYPHLRFFTRKTLAAITRRAGLSIEQMTTCGSGLGLRDLVVPTNILMAARKLPAAALTGT